MPQFGHHYHFVKYLGKTGKCIVEETSSKGWYVTYIERDLQKQQRDERTVERLKAEQQAEDAFQIRIERQRIEAAKMLDSENGNGTGGSSTMHATEATILQGDPSTIQLQLSNLKTTK